MLVDFFPEKKIFFCDFRFSFPPESLFPQRIPGSGQSIVFSPPTPGKSWCTQKPSTCLLEHAEPGTAEEKKKEEISRGVRWHAPLENVESRD